MTFGALQFQSLHLLGIAGENAAGRNDQAKDRKNQNGNIL
jgi:hypothetical protein